MTKSQVKDVALGLVILVLIILSLWYQFNHSAEMKSVGSITYHKAIGGEDRRVQAVKLSCYTGASKGAPNSNMWCYETVLEEWTE